MGLYGNLYRHSPAAAGFVFENLVFLLLKEQIKLSSAKLNFWRTKDKAEVDFIIERGTNVIPVEVKYRKNQADFSSLLCTYVQDFIKRPV